MSKITKKAANSQRRAILLAAKYISLVFRPFYLPIMGMTAIFIFTQMRAMPLLFIIMALTVTYCFTILLPRSIVRLYQSHQGWSRFKLHTRDGHMVGYLVFILCYVACYYIMNIMHMPHFMSAIVMAAIVLQMVSIMVNHWWKISAHTAAIGGTAGAVVAFSVIFGFNPLWWFCVLTLLAGVVGTGRRLLLLHSDSEVVGGYVIGFFAGLITVLTV